MNRLQFLNELFLNKGATANVTQVDVLDFYELQGDNVVRISEYLTLDGEKIQSEVGLPILFGEV